MSTQEELENSIKKAFPLLFGGLESIERNLLDEKYNALVAYAASTLEPFLSVDTIRYQSILLYVSLFFASVNLLNLKSIKYEDNPISVDIRLTVLYSVFILAITLIFLAKAYFDSQRVLIGRSKRSGPVEELIKFVSDFNTKSQIQNYYWEKLFHEIGEAYQIYRNSMSGIVPLDTFDFKMPIDSGTLDVEKLRLHPDFVDEIAMQERGFNSLCSKLLFDRASFEEASSAMLSQLKSQTNNLDELSKDTSYDKLITIRKTYLDTWFEARTALSLLRLKLQLGEMANDPISLVAHSMHIITKRTVFLRRVYKILEIVAPVLFAVGVVLIVWLPKSNFWPNQAKSPHVNKVSSQFSPQHSATTQPSSNVSTKQVSQQSKASP